MNAFGTTLIAQPRWSAAAALALCLAAPLVSAQAPTPVINNETSLIEAPAPGSKPRKIALVSAVGSVIHVVVARESVGSRLDPFQRSQLKVPDFSLDRTILRGLDKSVERVDPTAERILLEIDAPNLDNEPNSTWDRVLTRDLTKKLQGFEARKDWDLIITVTPRYQHTDTQRMGDKLWGIGVYMYGLGARDPAPGGIGSIINVEHEDIRTLKGELVNTNHFVASYAYLRFTVYDAKTLEPLRVYDRLDARKFADPTCAGNNISACFTPDQYANIVFTQSERTAAAGVAGIRASSVTLSDPRVVKPQGGDSAPAK